LPIQIDILNSFGDHAPAQTAADIVARTGLPRSSVFRALRSLVRTGFVYQNDLTKQYMLGPRVLELGMIARRQLSSEEVVASPLLDLAGKTRETVTFSVVEVPWRICVYVLDAPSDLRQVVQVGARYPLHLGAAGKVILAYLPEDVVDSVFRAHAVARSHAKEIVAELETIQNRGFAETASERVPGALSAAAPVFVAGAIYGGVAVVGPTERVMPVIKNFEPLVVHTASTLSRRLSPSENSRSSLPAVAAKR
jgi:IclR family transcriptional regulator, KDG regulon repressor